MMRRQRDVTGSFRLLAKPARRVRPCPAVGLRLVRRRHDARQPEGAARRRPQRRRQRRAAVGQSRAPVRPGICRHRRNAHAADRLDRRRQGRPEGPEGSRRQGGRGARCQGARGAREARGGDREEKARRRKEKEPPTATVRSSVPGLPGRPAASVPGNANSSKTTPAAAPGTQPVQTAPATPPAATPPVTTAPPPAPVTSAPVPPPAGEHAARAGVPAPSRTSLPPPPDAPATASASPSRWAPPGGVTPAVATADQRASVTHGERCARKRRAGAGRGSSRRPLRPPASLCLKLAPVPAACRCATARRADPNKAFEPPPGWAPPAQAAAGGIAAAGRRRPPRCCLRRQPTRPRVSGDQRRPRPPSRRRVPPIPTRRSFRRQVGRLRRRRSSGRRAAADTGATRPIRASQAMAPPRGACRAARHVPPDPNKAFVPHRQAGLPPAPAPQRERPPDAAVRHPRRGARSGMPAPSQAMAPPAGDLSLRRRVRPIPTKPFVAAAGAGCRRRPDLQADSCRCRASRRRGAVQRDHSRRADGGAGAGRRDPVRPACRRAQRQGPGGSGARGAGPARQRRQGAHRGALRAGRRRLFARQLGARQFRGVAPARDRRRQPAHAARRAAQTASPPKRRPTRSRPTRPTPPAASPPIDAPRSSSNSSAQGQEQWTIRNSTA